VVADFSNCYDLTFSPVTAGDLVMALGGSFTVTLQPDPVTCKGKPNPVIKSASPNSLSSSTQFEILSFGAMNNDDYQGLSTVIIKNIDIDGNNQRPCIALNSLKKVTLTNVNLINCVGNYSGAALNVYETQSLAFTKGSIRNAQTYGYPLDELGFQGGGGALWVGNSEYKSVVTLKTVK